MKNIMEFFNIITSAIATLGFLACIFSISLDITAEAERFVNKKKIAKLNGRKFNTKRNLWKAAYKMFTRLVFSIAILIAFVKLSNWVGNMGKNLDGSYESVFTTIGISVVMMVCTVAITNICLIKNKRYDKIYRMKISIAKEA